jgi:hypothetical protein
MQQLFDKVKDGTIGCSLKHAGEKHAILCIRRQDPVTLFTLISSYLNRRRPKRGPTCPSKTDPFVAARLINIDKLIGVKG